jgi:hypothetical protein
MAHGIFIVPLALLAVACHPAWQGDGDNDTFLRPPSVSSGSATAGASSSLESTIPPQPAVDLATVVIGLERRERLAHRPNYRVLIYGDGRVRYTGHAFVRDVGERVSFLPEPAVRELLDRFEQARFFDLRDSPEGHVTDLDSTSLFLRVGAQQNHVEDSWVRDRIERKANGGEIHRDLDAIADAIDATVHIECWIGTDEERQQLFEGALPGHSGSR